MHSESRFEFSAYKLCRFRAATGPASLHHLPPEVAARQAGRTVALAPALDAWLVVAAPLPPLPRLGATLASSPMSFSPHLPRSSPCPEAFSAPGPGAAGAERRAVEWGRLEKAVIKATTGGSGDVRAAVGAGGLLFVDVDQRGRVMELEDAQQRFPGLPVSARLCRV